MKSLGLKITALLCALSLWFFVVSGKNYQISIDLPLRIEQLPALLALASHVPQHIPVILEGKGLDLIRIYNQQKLAWLEIDLSRGLLGKQSIRLQESMLRSTISGVRLVRILGDPELPVELDTRIRQAVPVRLNARLEPAAGYMLVGEPTLIPQEIELSGARKVLTRVFEISTSSSVFRNLKGLDTIEVALNSEGLPSQIQLFDRTVLVVCDVQKRVSRHFKQLPVTLVGPYQRGVHSVSPERADLVVVGGERMLDSLDPRSLRIFVEFTRFALEGSDSLPPTVVIDDPVESWSISPPLVRLLTQPSK